MKDYQKSFLKLALDSQSLQFGDFTLKSGRKSPYFFNAANMLKGSNLYQLAQCYVEAINEHNVCLLYTSPSPRDATLSRMPSSA